MPSWKFVLDQLENAELLARYGQKPRQAALRRAVSTSYYALFQALCELTARNLVGWRTPWEAFTPVFRSIDHARARAVLGSHRLPHPLGDQVKSIGNAFTELQDAREWADYNPEPHFDRHRVQNGPNFTRAEALRLVGIARDAVELLNALDEETQKKLAALLIARPRKEANR